MSESTVSILVADDEVAIGCCVALLLRRAGYACRTVFDGNATWRALQEKRPSLLVLDLQLPGLSGFELCKRVRQDPDLCDLPILVLTGQGLPISRDWRRSIDADGFLLKPIEPRKLVVQVQLALTSGSAMARRAELERDAVLPVA